MMRKKYHIAIAGTFDVENYGDLMFPVIFEKAMKDRGLNFELYLFSPSESNKKALDNTKMVYSYREFEELHNKYHFDALVIGGGAIIHFRNIEIKLPNKDKYENYRNIDSWYTVAYLAAKNNIKILFNVPQAPFSFSESVSLLAESVFLAADYLSVRDEFSKKNIKVVLGNHKNRLIRVYPDSVCGISQYYNKEKLTKEAKRLIGYNGKYVVIHFSRVMPIEVEPVLVQAIKNLIKHEYKVVFLPLGYTHGDDVAMRALKEKYGIDCFVFEKKLSVDEMTAVLAGCDLYVGTSFHGSIVSIAFGNKALSFNYYEPTLKNIDNYKRFNIDNYLVNNYKELLVKLNDILINGDKFRPSLNKNLRMVNEHFDNLYRNITQKEAGSFMNFPNMREALLDTVSLLPRNDDDKEGYLAENRALGQEKTELLNEIESIKAAYSHSLQELEEYKKNYELLVNSRIWRATKPIRLVREKYEKRRQGGLKKS